VVSALAYRAVPATVGYHVTSATWLQDSLQTLQFRVPSNMPCGPAVFPWIWLNHEHESFMNCASVQIGLSHGISTMSVYSSSTATCYTALPAPTDGILRERKPYETGNFNRGLTRSRWEHTKHRHSRKHHRYYVRKAYRDQSPRQHQRILERLASNFCDWNSAPRMETNVYFSTDANCAPDAKLNNPRSDTFEIGRGDACGIVEGDNEYAIRNIEC
jgi:hypothetical protein